MDQKHWGCRGPLIIDARIKPQHAPPLVEDPHIDAGSTPWPRRAGRCMGSIDWHAWSPMDQAKEPLSFWYSGNLVGPFRPVMAVSLIQ